LLEGVLADALDVLLRDDPARAGAERAVERGKVRRRLLEDEADFRRADDDDLLDGRLQQLRRAAAEALERKLHVLRGDGIAVVELRALAQRELRGESVARHRPGLGEARRGRRAGHR